MAREASESPTPCLCTLGGQGGWPGARPRNAGSARGREWAGPGHRTFSGGRPCLARPGEGAGWGRGCGLASREVGDPPRSTRPRTPDLETPAWDLRPTRRRLQRAGRTCSGWGRWGLFLAGVQFGTHLARCKVIYEVKVSNEATSWRPDPALWVLLGALLWKINFNPIIKSKSEKHICPCGPELGSAAFLRQVAPPKGLVLLRGHGACRTLIQGVGRALSCRSPPPGTPTPCAACSPQPGGAPSPLPPVLGATPTPGAQSPPAHRAGAWELPSTSGAGAGWGRGGVSSPRTWAVLLEKRLPHGGWAAGTRSHGLDPPATTLPGPPGLGARCSLPMPCL